MLKIYFALFSTLFYFVYGDLFLSSNYDKPNHIESLVACIVNISATDLYFKTTVVFKLKNNKSAIEEAFNNELIHKLGENSIAKVVIENFAVIDKKAEVFDANCLLVVYIDDCRLLKQSNFRIINKKIRYLIVIDNYLNCNENFREVRHYVSKYDITFITKKLYEDKYELATFIPHINGITCEETVTTKLILSTCANGAIDHAIVFPQKNPTNLKKCPLRVGMGPLYPFSTIKDKESLKTFDPIDDVKGLDVEIIKIISEYLNATLDLYYILKKEENPLGYLDFLPFVINGSLEVCAGGLYRIYGDLVDYSGIYARQAVSWIYSVNRENRSWQNLVKKMNGLYIFIIFYVLYSCIWYLICLYDGDAVSVTETMLYGWGALVGAASLQNATSLKQKILNIIYLVLCIHLSAYISIQFYSFLTIRGPPEMFGSNDDVMQSGRTPFLRPVSKYFVNDEKYERFANTSIDCESFLDCSKKTLANNGLTVLLQGYFLNFQAETAESDEARVLRSSENILTVYYEMIIRKNSPLVVTIQKLILRLFEAGIAERLYAEGVGISVVDKANLAAKNMIGSSYSCQVGCTITVMQISGAFYIWMGGCAISCCVFLLELIKRKKK